MRRGAFRAGESSQASHHVRLAGLALHASFAYGSFMHLSPTEVTRQLMPEALCPLGVFFASLFCIIDSTLYISE